MILKKGITENMGISESFKNFANQMQVQTRNTTASLSQRLLRLVSGFFVGLVIGLIVQEMTQSGALVLFFITILVLSIIYRLLSKLHIVQILIFDLICILIATLLKMYIMIAP